MKTVFVTGANGLLGTNLIHILLEQNYHVKGLVRNNLKYKGKHSPNLQLIEGSLFDDFLKILEDVDFVVHIAACTYQNLLNYHDYRNINSNATIQLFHAAAKCRVKKFVFVSTVNTLGHGSINSPGTENMKVGKPFTSSMYAKSKMEAEQLLLNQNCRMETVIINPSFMLGPFVTKQGSGKIILMGWKKKFVFYPPGGKNFVHVKDVAYGIIRCFSHGKNGEKYIVANENLTYRNFFEKLNLVSNQKPVMVKIPGYVLKGAGVFGEILRAFGIKTNLSLINMKIICTSNFYSNEKSIRELGLNYRPVDEAISDALNYFKKEKQMKNKNDNLIITKSPYI